MKKFKLNGSRNGFISLLFFLCAALSFVFAAALFAFFFDSNRDASLYGALYTGIVIVAIGMGLISGGIVFLALPSPRYTFDENGITITFKGVTETYSKEDITEIRFVPITPSPLLPLFVFIGFVFGGIGAFFFALISAIVMTKKQKYAALYVCLADGNAACLDIEHKIPCSKKMAEKIAETLGKELKQEVAG